jgi:septal ring factor EnvC (AmiA/AmiB activator)
MKRTVTKGCLVAALAALAVCGGSVTAARADADQSVQASQARLAALRARIAALTGRLGDELAARDALRARLRRAELDITAKRQRLDSLRAAQLAATRHRAELHAEELRARAAQGSERAALAGQMRAAFMTGREEPIKLLLNQGDPASAGRMLAYYGFFARERTAQIAAIDLGVKRLAQLGDEIERQTAALNEMEAAARRELAELLRARSERAEALAALAGELTGGTRELATLKREEQAVEALLQDLARVLEDFPVDTQQPFGQLRGKLSWPVSGRVAAHFQDLRADSAQGALRWNGVLIETGRGAKVRAAYFGRVVYADWLQGLGLLMILGHSDGYLTLYGHAEVLYKSVGDWVAPGDVIAGLSDADGARPTLYFEIRQGRKPVDPKPWMKAPP